MNNDQFFKIHLENFGSTRVVTEVKPFFGTLEQIHELIQNIEANEYTAMRYQSTIRGFQDYLNGELAATHCIAGKTMRLLTPVKKLASSAYVTRGVQWTHKSFSGTSLDMHADLVNVQQVLVQDEDTFIRCVRPHFQGLHVEDPACEWLPHPEHTYYGFPYIFKTFDDALQLRLYVVEELGMTETECLPSLFEPGCVEYTEVCNELFGNTVI